MAQYYIHKCVIAPEHIDGSVQESNNSIANALELLHSNTEPTTYTFGICSPADQIV